MQAAASEPDRDWFGFLALAREELRAPILALVLALAALFIISVPLKAAAPRWAFLLPGLVFLGAALWGWIATYRRLQALSDQPLAKIASAAQGYVALEGRAAHFPPGKPLESPLTRRACCWYSCKVSERDEERARTTYQETGTDTSEWSFMMEDGSGECVVDPVGAKLIPIRVSRWHDDNYVYIERLILAGDPLFVLGEFATAGASATDYDIGYQVGERIAEWKKDMQALARRFDLNGDGRFSEQEWDLVRAQARREVRAELAARPPQPQNLVAKPRDERPMIISARTRRQLETDLRIWAGIHLASFLAGAALLARWALRA